MVKGHDTPSLRILAGLLYKEDSIIEIESYLLKSLEELDIPVLEEDGAIKAYTYQILTEILNGEIEKEKAVSHLSRIAIEKEYPPYLMDFYLLHFTLDDLKHNSYPGHWHGVTKENIDQIILQTATDWLDKHQEY